ncbi:MAG TPA: MmgE/PrpD family protein [Hyphomicrobiaceae bacterium]|nr:MmgE/PrpD family protein [Hyphomicrobiaceae bacterium]
MAHALASFVCSSHLRDLPREVRHEARRSILNFVGTALGGGRDPSVPQALTVLGPLSGPGVAVVAGQSLRLDILNAAFMNAMTANVLEFDDTHQPTVIHPTAPVLPPLLALADRSGCSGRALIEAFVAGVDVACRLGLSVSPGHYARGWHITATCGAFGSAAASARLLGLDRAQTAHALGIAASAASGIVENLPTGAKNVGVGNAARNGLFAALVAEQGYTAAQRAIEAKLGWARASGDDVKTDELLGGLGERFELMRNTYKPYPCGVVLNAVVDACLALRAEGLTGDAVEAVVVSGNALLLARADRPAVANDRDAKISIQHSVAVALGRGAAGIAEYSQPFIEDPAIAALRARVSAEQDASAPPLSATVTVTTKAGRRLRRTVLKPKGSLDNPLSDREIEAKVRDLAAFGGWDLPVEPIIDAVWRLDELDDVRVLTGLLTRAR